MFHAVAVQERVASVVAGGPAAGGVPLGAGPGGHTQRLLTVVKILDLGFSEALRSALREDPDVVLVGEMRDLETIRLALTAAETGHLVFGTLHTSSAAKTIDRVVDVFPAQEKEMVRAMLSESLRAVISQTLLKRNGGGRIAAHEIMIGTPAIRNLIREGKIAQMYSAIQTGAQQGMQTLDQCLAELVTNGVVSKEEARYKASNKDAL
jgi:twitching motility protein PilT